MLFNQTFTVEGTGNFPYDMLRYDRCYPASGNQSNELSDNPLPRPDDYLTKSRQVQLRRLAHFKGDRPTIDRWKSFGWVVLEETIETVKA